MADHMTDLMMESLRSSPDRLCERVDTPKEKCLQFLASEPGKALVEESRAEIRESVRTGIDDCVAGGTRQQIDCSLRAKNRADVDACDQMHAR